MRRWLGLLVMAVGVQARAVVVRGHVASQLGQPLPGSRVQLIRLTGGARDAADTIAGVDGSYELRTDLAGRFLLLTSPSITTHGFAPQVGNMFYGGRTDLLTIDVALDASVITPQTSSQGTLLETPLGELAESAVQVPADELLAHATAIPELRPAPGAFVVELGQTGTPAQLYVRGAAVARTTVDGVSAERLGGGFNLATVTTDGLAAVASGPAVEVSAGANPLQGVDAEAGTLSFATAEAATLHPVVVYQGDAGTLSTVRHEVTGTVVYRRADALISLARLNTDNDLPAERVHFVTSAANLGYRISGNTSLRLTLRDDVSAAPMASPYYFYGVAPETKVATQNLYGGFRFETRTAGDWHNLLRYGMVRERAEAYDFATPATGLPVTIVGANGYRAAGKASFLPVPAREDEVTNRDEGTWQTDYPVAKFLTALLTVRYQDERGADLPTAFSYAATRVERTHLSFAGAFQGEIKHRLFFVASGSIDRASGYGVHGAPSVGLTYAAVRQGTRKFRGTTLRFAAGTGFGEPSVLEQELVAHAVYARSRTFDAGVEQTILPRKVWLRTTYFHGQYAHQAETLSLAPVTLSDGLGYRAQGVTVDVRYQPTARLLLDGGYTYLASLVEETRAAASFNPALPGVAIGATTALAGARPFDRAPGTGYVVMQVTRTKFTASLKSTFASRSDGTTGLVLNPGLLLPNRNLSPGYASLDANVTANVGHALMLYAEFANLTDDRNIAPIGYLGTPFRVRVGLRIRLGKE